MISNGQTLTQELCNFLKDSLSPSIHVTSSFLVIVVENDLTKENVDAVVNAANSWLRHGGGVGCNNIISFLPFFFSRSSVGSLIRTLTFHRSAQNSISGLDAQVDHPLLVGLFFK